MKNPLVSIIITTKNSARTLEALMKSLYSQTYKPLEIILVDNNSSDKTPEIAKKYTRLVFQKGPERSAQRNFGIAKAKGEFCLVLDSDMVLEKDVVKECVGLLTKNPSLGAIIIPERSFGQGFWSSVKTFERSINEGENYFEAARFFPKTIITKLGGYDEQITGPEDWDLPQRVAKLYPIGRIKTYINHDEGNHTLMGLARKKYYYGLSVHSYLKKQGLSPVSARTIYLLRPAFYRNWKRLLQHPELTLGLVIMLTAETVAGGWGYLKGRMKSV